MIDPLKAQIEREELARLQSEERLASAAAVPLPGSLADAFAIRPEIEVGPYKVRPFYDWDIEILQLTNHPLAEVVKAWINGGEPEKPYIPRGPDGWMAAWIFTRDIDTAEKGILAKTASEDAKREFGRLGAPALLAISQAIARQMVGYFATIVSYGEPAKEGDKGNPPAAGEPQTG